MYQELPTIAGLIRTSGLVRRTPDNRRRRSAPIPGRCRGCSAQPGEAAEFADEMADDGFVAVEVKKPRSSSPIFFGFHRGLGGLGFQGVVQPGVEVGQFRGDSFVEARGLEFLRRHLPFHHGLGEAPPQAKSNRARQDWRAWLPMGVLRRKRR